MKPDNRKENRSRRRAERMITEPWMRGFEDAKLAKFVDERAKTNPNIAPDAKRSKRKKIKPDIIFIRPVCRPGRDCPDRPNQPPAVEANWVWQPDIAAQLNTGGACPGSTDLSRIEQGVRGNLSRFQ